jgi:hypothetical protein
LVRHPWSIRCSPTPRALVRTRTAVTILRGSTAASRTPPWLLSGWGCRGRRFGLGCHFLLRVCGLARSIICRLGWPPVRFEILFLSGKTVCSFLLPLGVGCLVVVVLTHVCEALHLFPWMNWGQEHSIGHYLDFWSAVLALMLFPIGYLLHALTKRHASKQKPIDTVPCACGKHVWQG